MPNINIRNNDIGNVVLASGRFDDDTAHFAAAGTWVEGTILARSTAEGATEGKLVPFAPGGANGTGVPRAVLSYDVEGGEAADVAVRPLVAGEVRAQRLIIHADGDGSNVDNTVLDLLRETSIIPLSVTDRSVLDNQ